MALHSTEELEIRERQHSKRIKKEYKPKDRQSFLPDYNINNPVKRKA